MKRDDWYRVDDMPPPYTVRVWLEYAGRQFIGVRSRDPSSGHDVWAAIHKDMVEPLAMLDGARPHLWRPQYPEMWKAPLPQPVVLSYEGVLRSERLRFGAVEEAEASELAREMERDRDDARRGSGSVGGDEVERPWWMDATAIRYEVPPDLTLRMVEGRLMRALLSCGADRGRSVKIIQSGGFADLADAIGEAMADFQSSDIVRIAQLPQDHADFDVAMSWFCELNRPDQWSRWRQKWSFSKAQRVLLYRALPTPLSFYEIGQELRWRGHQRAQQVFKASIDICWRVANGLVVSARDREIEALRRRNREHRTEGSAQ